MGNPTYPYKKALVTGAGRGIGAALCRSLVEQSVEVVALNRSRAPLESLIAEIDNGGKISPYYVDVTKFDELESTLSTILEQHPDIDLVILNAGVDKPQRIEQFDWRIARTQIDTNLTANYVFASSLVPHLLKQENGCFALVSSLGSYMGCPYEHAYNASKAGVRMLVDGLRAELVEHSINITGIYPGFIDTDMLDDNAFQIASRMPVSDAATIVIEGLRRGEEEIHFPKDTSDLVLQAATLPVEQRVMVVRELMNEDSGNL